MSRYGAVMLSRLTVHHQTLSWRNRSGI